MKIRNLVQIQSSIHSKAVLQAMQTVFVAWSRNEAVMPPVGHLRFSHPPGDVHIKYGYRHGSDTFVVKIASSFYHNPKQGLSSSQGMMLLFDAHTGQPRVLLQDEGWLTDARTAAAGAVAARYLAPQQVSCIGIVGAGTQARFQLDMLRHVTPCRNAMVWARDPSRAAALEVPGFSITVAPDLDTLAAHCNLIVTTTPSDQPLLHARQIRPGTHITAVGADSPGKQELHADLLPRADVWAVDARDQCLKYGDTAAAVSLFPAMAQRLVELGEIIQDPNLGRTHPGQITVCDLTGLAIQDLEIARLAA